MKRIVVILLATTITAASAFAQDAGIRDTCRYDAETYTWNISTVDDTLFFFGLWGWSDNGADMDTVSATSLGFRVSTNGNEGYGPWTDSLIAVDSFIHTDQTTATTKTFKRSILDTLWYPLDPSTTVAHGYNGYLIGHVNSGQIAVFQTSTRTEIGQLILKVREIPRLPPVFTIEIDSIFFLPDGSFEYFVYSGLGFVPEFSEAVITVNNPYNTCVDTDGDGYGDQGHPENECPEDNCQWDYNPGQEDGDGDGVGDICDNCPNDHNPGQDDSDSDGIGDVCDTCTDTDGDGYGDPGYPSNTCPDDNCPLVVNPDQEDMDSDAIGDSCDNCLSVYNPEQEDSDIDGIGDSCDTCTDTDGDSYGNPGFPTNTCDLDNCPTVYNPDQEDTDDDSLGDSCDNCLSVYNPEQEDSDIDGIGDSCDTCTDTDGDSYGNPGFPTNTCDLDNCPTVYNPDQEDYDGDGIGDSCDVCTDTDGDDYGNPGFPANTCDLDNCPIDYNPLQEDVDEDEVGDSCDVCPYHVNDDCCNPVGSNLPPEITSAEAYIAEPAPDPWVYVLTAIDPNCDGSELVFSFEDYPVWMSVNGNQLSGVVECYHENTTFTVITSDGDLADTLEVSLIIDKSNQSPVIADTVEGFRVRVAETFIYYPTILDPDDSVHTVSYPIIPNWCTVQNDSVIGVAPDVLFYELLKTVVQDYCNADTASFFVRIYPCGDADMSGEVDIDDVVFLIQYIFAGGPAPEPLKAGDVDCTDDIDIDDVVYLIAYIFSGGPEPCADCP